MIVWILASALALATVLLVFVLMLLYRALVKLDNYSLVVGDVAADMLKFNRFIEEVNENQMFFDTEKNAHFMSTWRFFEHTMITSCESLEIIVDGGHILPREGEADGQA